jgi:glucose/arabinose dehydrogenase
MRFGFPRTRRAVMCLTMSASALVGCAHFDSSASAPFTTEARPARQAPAPSNPPETSPAPRPKGPCVDQDRAVVATCLDSTGGLVTTGNDSGLVTERRTGRILQVRTNQKPVEVMTVPVDGSGDGGLLSIALSPSYDEDGLIYAYISTPTDNRVVRIAKGDMPKNILTGIPKGPTDNSGAIMFATPTQLLVLTGDAGDPAAAANPASLAGKLLRVNNPAPGMTAPPTVAVSGIGAAGGLCADDNSNIWVTDRTPIADRLQRLASDGQVVSPVWTWPDHPGVGGCAVSGGGIGVSLGNAKAMAYAPIDPKTFAITTAPTLIVQNRYGMLKAAALAPDGSIWVGTVNKNPGGKPGPNDDRVVKIPPPGGAGGGKD